jgi:glycosyltransferase involved in cell wall biosynthesis
LNVSTARLWPRPGLALLHRGVRGRLLDLHDHPRIQTDAFGIAMTSARRQQLDRQVRSNTEAFELLAVQSAAFAALCDLPEDRVIVAPNGTDTSSIRPGPMGTEPVVAMVSGAAPGRGIELLIAAVERVRQEEPVVTLRLGLAATGPASGRYVAELQREIAPLGWTRIATVPYAHLSEFLASARALVIPHPPHAYYDAVLPVKLFDGMAAGRATVVTPRHETARVITESEAGIVANGDTADDLAEAILQVLRDEALQVRLGASARQAAVKRFDWKRISENLAAAVAAAL